MELVQLRDNSNHYFAPFMVLTQSTLDTVKGKILKICGENHHSFFMCGNNWFSVFERRMSPPTHVFSAWWAKIAFTSHCVLTEETY